MPRSLVEFKETRVPGLYSYDHYEAEDGAFIQRRHGPEVHYVYQDARGERFEFGSYTKLKAHLQQER